MVRRIYQAPEKPDFLEILMKIFFLSLVLAFSFYPNAQAEFPRGPRLEATPGELCAHPDSYRYPEHIPYCTRNVDAGLKQLIIAEYDSQFGYAIQSMPRGDFKIDHYVPLCAGGSNSEDN